jgi:cleavage stimulation factor subunit 3
MSTISLRTPTDK